MSQLVSQLVLGRRLGQKVKAKILTDLPVVLDIDLQNSLFTSAE